MRVKIDRDEWWPVYGITPSEEPGAWGEDAEISEELYEKYKKANYLFTEVNSELGEIYDGREEKS